MEFSTMALNELLCEKGHACACGRVHKTGLRKVFLGAGVLNSLADALQEAGVSHPFVVSDANTDVVAGDKVRGLLQEAKIPYHSFVFPPVSGMLEPDERSVGALCMAFDPACDGILAIGSGVLNDCCKTLAHAAHVPSIVVGTAPSMDGYASDNASMIQNHSKVSLYNASPVVIIADTDILVAAPEDMLKAGLGDMLAKYISICEWRISHLITDEFYCENIAQLVRSSLAKIRQNAEALLQREPAAIEHVVEGLILSGVAMSFAEISRPASGLEHYFSHLWEMDALQQGKTPSLHGIQVGVGTCLTLKCYDKLRGYTPDEKAATEKVQHFSAEEWERGICADFREDTARELLDLEKKAQKNSPQMHAVRLQKLLAHWDQIQQIMADELPTSDSIIALMQKLGMAVTPQNIGLTREDAVSALMHSRDIREKYLTSSMLWDLGELENFAELL